MSDGGREGWREEGSERVMVGGKERGREGEKIERVDHPLSLRKSYRLHRHQVSFLVHMCIHNSLHICECVFMYFCVWSWWFFPS